MENKYVVNLTIRNTFIIESDTISDNEIAIIKGKTKQIIKECIDELSTIPHSEVAKKVGQNVIESNL